MNSYTLPDIDWSILAPMVAVLLTGVVALLIEMLRPKQNNNLIVGTSVVGLGIAFAFLAVQLGLPADSTLKGMVIRDQFALFTQMLVVGATALVFLFSEPYLRAKRIAYGEFYPLALWSASGAMLMLSSHNLLAIFVGLEVLSITLYVLVALSRQETRSEEGGLKYFLLGAFASALLLYGMAFVYGAAGTLDLQSVRITPAGNQVVQTAFGIAMEAGGQNYIMATFGLMLILIGLGFKISMVPFHQWTPDVYQGAPTNITAFMASVSKIAAFGALFRVLTSASEYQHMWIPLLIVLAIATMTVGNLMALGQQDVKRALAYSSIAHAGYLLVGILAHFTIPERIGLGSVVFYLAVYTLMTVGSFAVVALTAQNGDESTRTLDLRGLWRKDAFAAGAMLIFIVSLVGMPPFGGFWGKLAIFSDAMTAGLVVPALALAVNSVLSTFYYWRIIRAAFVEDESATSVPPAVSTPLARSVIALCAAGVLLGMFGLSWFQQSLGTAEPLARRETVGTPSSPAGLPSGSAPLTPSQVPEGAPTISPDSQ